jgi:putative transposase
LLFAARYIERNPVRAGVVEKPWQWPWSSAIEHINDKSNGIIKLGNFFELIGMSGDSWKKYIDSQEEESFLQSIRKYTINGRPLGTNTFIEQLEAEIGRSLRALPIGRPKENGK